MSEQGHGARSGPSVPLIASAPLSSNTPRAAPPVAPRPAIHPQRLDDLAHDLSRDVALRELPPEQAAEVRLRSVARDGR